MRCLSCDCILQDHEATRKGTFSGEYLDLCDNCLQTIPDIEYSTLYEVNIEDVDNED